MRHQHDGLYVRLGAWVEVTQCDFLAEIISHLIFFLCHRMASTGNLHTFRSARGVWLYAATDLRQMVECISRSQRILAIALHLSGSTAAWLIAVIFSR